LHLIEQKEPSFCTERVLNIRMITNHRAPITLLLTVVTLSVAAQTTPQQQDAKPVEAATKPQSTVSAPDKPENKADAYYHYMLSRSLEESAMTQGAENPVDMMQKSTEELKLAIASDPESPMLQVALSELYARNNRIREAISTVQAVLAKHPDDLDAHKLLGRIYLHSIGDPSSGSPSSREMLRLAVAEFEQITRLEPTENENILLLGRLYLIQHDLPKAKFVLETVLAKEPTNEEAVLSLATTYNELGEAEHAKAVLDALPEKSRSVRYFATMGEFYEQQHDAHKASAAWRKALEQEKENPELRRRLASSLVDSGQLEDAIKEYTTLTTLDSHDGAALLRLGELQRRTGKFEEALKTFQRLDNISPNLAEVRYNTALTLAALGRYDEAIPQMQKLVEETAPGVWNNGAGNHGDGKNGAGKNIATADSSHGMFLERLGSMYRETGKTQSAIETFQRLTKLDDENAIRGYQEMVETLRDAKQFTAATAAAEEAANKFPMERSLKLLYATQLVDSGQPEKSIATAKSLLKGGTANASLDRDVYMSLAQIYARLKRWPESEEAAASAEKISNSPEEIEYAVFLRGSLYERQKKYETAEEMFRKVLARDPQNAMTLNYLGYMLADRGVRLDEALALIKKALDMDPQNSAYLDSLGWAYFRMGKYDLAEDNLRRALAKSVNDATMHDHIADLYQKTGRLRMAAAHWERALAEWNKSLPGDVDTEDVARVQKKLETARVKLAKENQ